MKKLFTLLTLLVAIVTGAQADPVTIGITNTLTTKSKDPTTETLTGSGADITISKLDLSSSSQALSNYTTGDKAMKDGSSTDVYSTHTYKWNKNTGTTISLPSNEYVGFEFTIAEGKTFSVSGINARLVSSANHVFRIVIEKSDGTVLYSSADKTINRTSDNVLTVTGITDTKVQNLAAGIYRVKAYLAFNSTGKYLVFKELQVTGSVEAATAPTAPIINAQPVSAKYLTGATEVSALSVAATASAGDLSYQWYSNTSESNVGGTAIDEATAASYTPSTKTAGTYYYYVRVTDGNGSTNSDVATITVEDAVAPTISVTPTAPSTYKGVATTLTANVTGVPDPTVTWYKNTEAATTGGTVAGTGLTYQPDVTKEGIFYYYAVADNDVEPSATSELVTLTVTDPNENITGNSYYIETGDVKVGGAKVFGQDITMQYTGFEGGSSAAVEDNMLNGVNSNYVASVSHSSANGWGVEFTPTANGILKVGVIINGGKTFTLTNVTSFDYNGVQDEGNNETSVSAGTNPSNTWKPSKKQWTVLTFDVVAGTTYKLSVAGSKMGFYGFEFTPTLTLTDAEGSTNATAIAALNGKTANVTVARTLSNSYYNTLFLPFAMDATQIEAAFGAKAQVATFSGMKSDTQFGFTNVTAMEANTGYLVKPAAAVNGFTVEGVTITSAASVTPSSDWIMYGTYDTFENSPTNEVYYFTTDGKVKKLAATGRIKGLRAFMMKGAAEETVKAINSNVELIWGGPGNGVPSQARADFFLSLDEGTTTGINSIENGQIDNDAPAYNLAGQKVGKGYKGIVIINGKKVVK